MIVVFAEDLDLPGPVQQETQPARPVAPPPVRERPDRDVYEVWTPTILFHTSIAVLK